jgi:putative integral membrane protein (TIGR02587 family)
VLDDVMAVSNLASDAGDERSASGHFAIGAARAFGGAVLFALPLLMTMEMWQLGQSMERWRLALMMVLMVPLLIALSYFAGFEETFSIKDDAVDAFAAFAIGAVASAGMLLLWGALDARSSIDEIVSSVALQTVPASIGALLAQSQFGGPKEENKRKEAGHLGELFLMVVGALFLALNVAPTEEIVVIAHRATLLRIGSIMLVSLAMMHALIFVLEFRGQAALPHGASGWHAFIHSTVAGYIVALAVSAYILWCFGRFDGTSIEAAAAAIVVLGLPASLGAAAARLIL